MHGAHEFRFAVTKDDDVVASTSENRIAWRLLRSRRRRGWGRSSQADALLTDDGDTVRCAVRCLRRFPWPRYTIHAGGERLGTIDGLNVWRTHYRIAFSDGRSCEFRLPMLSTLFIATAGDAEVARVRMLREDVWAVRFSHGEDHVELIAALARLLYARWHSE